MKLALMVSGTLGAKALAHIHKKRLGLCAVLTDKKSKGIIAFCEYHKINLFIGNPRGAKCQFPQEFAIDILLSVNYLFLVEEDLIKWPTQYAFNIHGSILPKYRGRTPHVWAIINGEKKTGATVHLIDDGCDTGDIVLQYKFPIKQTDTGAGLLKKFDEIYPQLIDKLFDLVATGTVIPRKQIESKATYFGKRTPADGLINWSWHQQRIKDWIRAQAAPYPGAFTYYKEHKLFIHDATLSDQGFSQQMPDGQILSWNEDRLLVKSPNGALELSNIKIPNGVHLLEGDLLT